MPAGNRRRRDSTSSRTSASSRALVDQIFGVDAGRGVPPVNTFHVGFWFDDPADAAACGFTGSTPFNGEHRAGPLAFVTRPDASTTLGPLCTDPTSGPNDSTVCNP